MPLLVGHSQVLKDGDGRGMRRMALGWCAWFLSLFSSAPASKCSQLL